MESCSRGNPDRPGSEFVKLVMTIKSEYKYDGDLEKLKNDILEFAKQNCTPYEVPKMIEIREAGKIPLTTIGKINKLILRKEN